MGVSILTGTKLIMPGNYSRLGSKLLANASVKQIFNPLALFLIFSQKHTIVPILRAFQFLDSLNVT